MNKDGFMLTIGGCPIVFISPGINIQNTSELPLTHTDFAGFASEVSLSSIAHGAFSPKFGSWTEKVDLATGLLDVTSLSFRIEDVLMDYLGTERNIASYLFTRDDLQTEQIDTFDRVSKEFRYKNNPYLAKPTLYGWINGECIRVEEWRENNSYPQKYISDGVFNTFRKNHDDYFDPAQNEFAQIFFEYPGVFNQEVLLWKRSSVNNVYSWQVLWRGVANRAPRSTSDGAAIEIQADSFVNSFNRSKYYHQQTNTKLVGFDSRRMAFKAAETSGSYSNGWFYSAKNLYTASSTNFLNGDIIFFKPKHTNALRTVVGQGNENFGLLGRIVEVSFTNKPTYSDDENGILLYTNIARPMLYVRPCMRRMQTRQGLEFQGSSDIVATSSLYKALISTPGDECFQIFRQNVNDPAFVQDFIVQSIPFLNRKTIPIDSGSLSKCLKRHLFEAELSDDNAMNTEISNNVDFGVEPAFTVQEGTGDRILRAYGGTYNENFYDREGSFINNNIGVISGSFIKVLSTDITKVEDRTLHVVQKEIQFKSYTALESMHWMDLYRYGIVNSSFEEKHFNFGFNYFTSLKLTNPSRKTEILLDGSKTNGELLSEFAKYYGIYQTVGFENKIGLFKPEKPTNSTIVTASISVTNLVDKPSWEAKTDEFVTTVKVKSDGFQGGELILNNKFAIGKFSYGKTIEIELANLGIERNLFVSSRQPLAEITAQLYDTYFDILSSPNNIIKFSTTLEYLNSIFIGSYVSLTDWIVPDGRGGRGLSQDKILIKSKTVDFQNGKIIFEAIKFPQIALYGISPCVKISSINTGSKILTLDTTDYIDSGATNAPQDYSASNLGFYNNVANDKGIGFFLAGHKVQLILRDSTAYSILDLTVSSVGTNTITVLETVTTSPVDWPAQAALGNVDLRFADYETAIDSQLTWAYIGDGDDGLINNSSQAQRIF